MGSSLKKVRSTCCTDVADGQLGVEGNPAERVIWKIQREELAGPLNGLQCKRHKWKH